MSSVETYEQQMKREKIRIALSSVIAAIFLTSMKLGVGLWTGSLGILSEAAHSGLDFFAALITLLAVRVSDKPPDKEHNYGHGKIENLSALIETILLLITCAWILYEAYHRLFTRTVEIDVNVWSFIVILVSVVIDFSRSRALYRIARKYHSQALEADALHFSTDIWSSAVVIVGLITVRIGFPEGDAISASIVAMIVLYVSIQLAKKTIDVLLDRVPGDLDEKVMNAIQSVNGVEEVRSVRIRQSGASAFIDVVIGIQRTTTFDFVHTIMTAVEDAVAAVVPRSDVIVHSEPMIGKNERMTDSINWLVNQYNLIPHNVTILLIDNKYHIDLDIEYPSGTSFENAHATAEQIEQRIKNEIENISHVSIHLEEEMVWTGDSIDVTKNEPMLINSIKNALTSIPTIKTNNSITCYKGERGLKVNVVCTLSPALNLKDVHDVVNSIETTISQLDHRIKKVFVDAEPFTA